VLPARRGAAGQARLLLALVAAGAGRAPVDRAAVPVSRQRGADAVLRDPRRYGLQRALREDAALPLLHVGDSRVARHDSRPAQRGHTVRAAPRRRGGPVLVPPPCLISRRRSAGAATA